jgi:CBS domain-containing protein
MKVSEVMKREVIKVKRSTSLRGLLNLFKDFHTLPLIPVVDDEDSFIGVVYLDNLLDILKPPQVKFLKNIPFSEVNEYAFDLELASAMGELILVDDIMDTDFVFLDDSVSLEDAYKTMCLHNKEQLPVVDKEKRLLGIVGIFDIVWRVFKEKGVV